MELVRNMCALGLPPAAFMASEKRMAQQVGWLSRWIFSKRQCTLGMKSGLLVGIGMYSASQHIPNIKDKGTERGQFLLASSLTECPSLEVATIETDMFAVCRLCC